MNAPIVLFVYNRLTHTKRTIESLMKNTLASESELFVYSDGGKNDADWEKVKDVRLYLRTVSGFKNVHMKERDTNRGLASSVITGVSEIISRFGKIIVLEDDMETSPYFLQFMNEALEKYVLDMRVGSIHGYLFPIHQNIPENFFLKYASCWGWATWQDRWVFFEENGTRLLWQIKNEKKEKEFDFNKSYPFTKMLKKQTQGKVNSWAIRWQASLFLKDKLALWPGKALVNNIGNDASGTHTGAVPMLDAVVSQTPVRVVDISIEENIEVRAHFEAFFRSLKKRRYSIRFIYSKVKQIIRKI